MSINDTSSIISRALRSLFANLCEVIYPMIVRLYDLFRNLSLYFYTDDFSIIYKKASLIIGIFMVFRVMFWLIEILISPEKMTDKEKKPQNIIVKIVVVVLMLALTPNIFQLAFQVQNKIIESNIIEKIISPNYEAYEDNDAGGRLAGELFGNFYTLSDIVEDSDVEKSRCEQYVGSDGIIASNIKNRITPQINGYCLNATKEVTSNNVTEEYYIINFNGLFAVAVGVFVLWMILMYCISVASRCVQLVFLQVVAPVPIMCYLTPQKDNMFSKWVKQCTTTYLDLFIRVAIIDFVLLLSNLLFQSNNLLNSIDNVDQSNWIKLFLVLGLLTFAKKAPDLIQELLPKSVTKASGDFGLSLKKRTESMVGGRAIYRATTTGARVATVGAATGAVTGAVGFLGGRGVTGRLSGLVGGTARGFVGGSRKGPVLKNVHGSIKRQTDVNRQKAEWYNQGSTWSGRMAQRMANTFGYAGRAETMDSQIRGYDNQIEDNKKEISKQRTQIAKKQRLSSLFSETSNIKSAMEDRAENKLLTESYDPNSKPKRYALQQRLIGAKAGLESAQSGNGQSYLKNQNMTDQNFINNRIKEKFAAQYGDNSIQYQNYINSGGRMKPTGLNLTDNDIVAARNRIKARNDVLARGNENEINAQAIQDAQLEYNAVLKKAKQDYITAVFNGDVDDAAMKSKIDNLLNMIRNAEEGTFDDTRYAGMTNEQIAQLFENGNGDYDLLDTFETATTTANNKISRDIYNANQQIKVYEDANQSLEEQKERITSSEEYSHAQADREAAKGLKGPGRYPGRYRGPRGGGFGPGGGPNGPSNGGGNPGPGPGGTP